MYQKKHKISKSFINDHNKADTISGQNVESYLSSFKVQPPLFDFPPLSFDTPPVTVHGKWQMIANKIISPYACYEYAANSVKHYYEIQERNGNGSYFGKSKEDTKKELEMSLRKCKRKGRFMRGDKKSERSLNRMTIPVHIPNPNSLMDSSEDHEPSSHSNSVSHFRNSLIPKLPKERRMPHIPELINIEIKGGNPTILEDKNESSTFESTSNFPQDLKRKSRKHYLHLAFMKKRNKANLRTQDDQAAQIKEKNMDLQNNIMKIRKNRILLQNSPNKLNQQTSTSLITSIDTKNSGTLNKDFQFPTISNSNCQTSKNSSFKPGNLPKYFHSRQKSDVYGYSRDKQTNYANRSGGDSGLGCSYSPTKRNQSKEYDPLAPTPIELIFRKNQEKPNLDEYHCIFKNEKATKILRKYNIYPSSNHLSIRLNEGSEENDKTTNHNEEEKSSDEKQLFSGRQYVISDNDNIQSIFSNTQLENEEETERKIKIDEFLKKIKNNSRLKLLSGNRNTSSSLHQIVEHHTMDSVNLKTMTNKNALRGNEINEIKSGIQIYKKVNEINNWLDRTIASQSRRFKNEDIVIDLERSTHSQSRNAALTEQKNKSSSRTHDKLKKEREQIFQTYNVPPLKIKRTDFHKLRLEQLGLNHITNKYCPTNRRRKDESFEIKELDAIFLKKNKSSNPNNDENGNKYFTIAQKDNSKLNMKM